LTLIFHLISHHPSPIIQHTATHAAPLSSHHSGIIVVKSRIFICTFTPFFICVLMVCVTPYTPCLLLTLYSVLSRQKRSQTPDHHQRTESCRLTRGLPALNSIPNNCPITSMASVMANGRHDATCQTFRGRPLRHPQTSFGW